MKKEVKYSKIVMMIIVFLVILVGIAAMFYFNLKKQNQVTVEGTVVYVGEHYIVVKNDNEEEYSLQTEQEYNVGDRVSFTMKDIKKDSYPKEGTLERLDTISKTVEFFISDSSENGEIGVEQGELENFSGTISSFDAENGEIAVVSYFKNLNSDLDNYSKDKSLGQDIKDGFVKGVDFLFYGGTINGKTFDELGVTTKLEILKLSFSIDQKIEKHFPGYKEDISSAGSKIYTDVKSKALKIYMNVTTKVCEDNPDICESAKDGLSELKRSFSLTWDYIKDISGEGISKLKTWYEIWREA